MAQLFTVHPDNPQPRLLKQAADLLRRGEVLAVPTDSSYALVCQLDDKAAADRLRRIRQRRQAPPDPAVPRPGRAGQLRAGGQRAVPPAQAGHAGTLHLHPGGHQGSAAPRQPPAAQDHRPARARAQGAAGPAALHGAPLLATTLILPDETPAERPAAIRERLEHDIAAVIDAGACPLVPTTVVDLSGDAPALLRRGRGDPARLGL
jgi:hypothetical protein